MAKDIWVISDTHLFHRNILNFTDSLGRKIRPFSSIGEMNEKILDRWNSVVKPGDKVYHLGDVTLGYADEFKSFWPKLNGSKRLIVGNHDDIKFLSSGGFFEKVLLWKVWPEYRMVFSHIPLHPSNATMYLKTGDYVEGDVGSKQVQMFNVHGHIHQNKSPDGPYFNVSCEAINYTPMHIEDLLTYAPKDLPSS
jgi:calcineurin-like phosphoesterase family protein